MYMYVYKMWITIANQEQLNRGKKLCTHSANITNTRHEEILKHKFTY